MLAAQAAAIIFLFMFLQPWGSAAAAGAVAEVTAGRESAIALSLGLGLPWWITWPLLAWQDLAIAAIVYPIFRKTLDHYHDSENRLMRRIRELESAADRHQHWVHRWGPVGLFVFLIVPFLVNGPVIALVVGRLGGLHLRDMVGAVVAGVVVGTGMWVLGFDALLRVVEGVHPWAGLAATATAVALILGGGVIADAWQKRRAGA